MARTKTDAASSENKERIVESLRKLIPPGSTIYTIATNVTGRNWDRRKNAFLVVLKDNTIRNISGEVSTALDLKWSDEDSVLTGGTGSNVVHDLSYLLHGDDDVGRKGKQAGKNGAPLLPTRTNYRAGSSLIHKRL